MTLEEFYTHCQPQIALFDAFCNKHLLTGSLKPDHICYKCGSKESFEHTRALLEGASEYLYQSIISKRRIAYIKLKKPIETVLGSIYFVELSDQKPDGSQHDGFDHIEVYATGFSYDDMVEKLRRSEEVIKVERPHHTTHDIDVGEGFLFRCTEEPLIEKIKREEMI